MVRHPEPLNQLFSTYWYRLSITLYICHTHWQLHTESDVRQRLCLVPCAKTVRGGIFTTPRIRVPVWWEQGMTSSNLARTNKKFMVSFLLSLAEFKLVCIAWWSYRLVHWTVLQSGVILPKRAIAPETLACQDQYCHRSLGVAAFTSKGKSRTFWLSVLWRKLSAILWNLFQPTRSPWTMQEAYHQVFFSHLNLDRLNCMPLTFHYKFLYFEMLKRTREKKGQKLKWCCHSSLRCSYLLPCCCHLLLLQLTRQGRSIRSILPTS